MTRAPQRIYVSAGEKIVATGPDVLVAEALGSCVAVTMWDPRAHVGGLAHVMLPSGANAVGSPRADRFAEAAVPALAQAAVQMGARRQRLLAKIVGGAAMFGDQSRMDSIGARNIAAVTDQLERLGIPIVASEVGGSHARTVELHLETGALVVRSHALGNREL